MFSYSVLQHREHVAPGRGHRRGAQVLGHFEPGTRGPDLEALQVGQRLDRLSRVEEGLRRADEHRDRDDAISLLPVLALHVRAAGFVEPVQHALGVEGPRVAAEQHRGRVLAPVVTDPGVAHFGHAVLDRFGHLERVAQRAAGKHLDLEAPAGELLHLLGEGLGADVHQRPAAPRGGHLPVVAGALCAHARGRQCKHGRSRAAFQEIALLHVSPPQWFTAGWFPSVSGDQRAGRLPFQRVLPD